MAAKKSPSKKTIRIGFLGGGNIVAHRHAPGFRDTRGFTVAGVADPNPAAVERIQGLFPARRSPKGYATLESMILIATPGRSFCAVPDKLPQSRQYQASFQFHNL